MTDVGNIEPGARPADPSLPEASVGPATVLCVDLDGALLRTDVALETLLARLRQRPFAILRLLPVILKGHAAPSPRDGTLADIDPELLRVRSEFTAYLRKQRSSGRQVVPTSEANCHVAESVAARLGLFDEVIGLDGPSSPPGSRMADALVQRFGSHRCVYARRAPRDASIWKHAAGAILVGRPDRLARHLPPGLPIEATFPSRAGNHAKPLGRQLRPHQWAKNLLDLEADRRHPRKKTRPFASGDLPLAYGALFPVLMAIGLAVAATVSIPAAALLLLYAVATTAYSMVLKTFALVDVFVLAGLYSLRILAGGAASGIHPSVWLIGLSSFVFLALAILRRYAEVKSLGEARGRRGYQAADLEMLRSMGLASSFASCVILSIYVDSSVAAREYAAPALLWVVVPLMLFWQCRLWLAAGRGQMHDDPLVYALGDGVSWVVLKLLVVVFILASSGVSLR